MPFNFNFDNALNDVKSLVVTPRGWRGEIVVEYCQAQAHQYDTMLSICWRVKGTEHTFTIYENKLNLLCNGDYAKHFTEVLEVFREDYKMWFTNEEYKDCEWKWNYKEQFGRYII